MSTDNNDNEKLYEVNGVELLDFTIGSAANEKQSDNLAGNMPIPVALKTVMRQLQAIGRRPRTIQSYTDIFTWFVDSTGIKYVHELNSNVIYEYLDSCDVSLSTKLIRLKTIKAVLSRFFDNGWLQYRFWTGINIRLDKKVKEGANVEDIMFLINAIDKTTFTGLRNAIAILLCYRTGLRIETLGKLRERHIDYTSEELVLDGSVQKNRSVLRLPLDAQLIDNLRILIRENDKIRKHYRDNKGVNNDYLFITYRGTGIINTKSNSNAISKALSKYARDYGLSNINVHAIRRAYAKNLLDQGANIALISKALGHADLATTTQYLYLSESEVSNSLRDFL